MQTGLRKLCRCLLAAAFTDDDPCRVLLARPELFIIEPQVIYQGGIGSVGGFEFIWADFLRVK